jgi:O-antigen/teichoic acid export membrane protein
MLKKLVNSYKAMSAAAKAAIWFAVCSILQKGISFVTVPIFTRLMTPEQYGQFSVYSSWNLILTIFATLNLSAGVFNNGMTKYPNDRNRYISSMQGLSTVVTLALLVVYLPFQNVINQFTGLSTVLMLIMFAEFLTVPAVMFWSARQKYEFKYVALFIYTFIVSVLSPGISLLAVVFSDEKGIAKIMAVALVNICAGLFFYIFNIIKGRKFFIKEYWSFAFKFNLPLIPHYLSMVVLAQSDKIMIERMFSEREVAIYSVAYSFSLIMNIITTSINSSYVPWTYRKLLVSDIKPLKRTTTMLLIGVGLISLLPVILAPEVMWIMAPKEYAQGMWIIPPISTSVFFTFMYSLFANVEFYFEKTKFVMVASTLCAVVNVILNAIFMPIFGYMAAGYTTMFCYMLLAFVHYLFMRRVCSKMLKISSVYDDKLILLISAAYLGLNAVGMSLYNFVILRYVILAVSLVLIFIKRSSIIQFVKKLKER